MRMCLPFPYNLRLCLFSSSSHLSDVNMSASRSCLAADARESYAPRTITKEDYSSRCIRSFVKGRHLLVLPASFSVPRLWVEELVRILFMQDFVNPT